MAHGTRKQQGIEMVGDIADRASASLGRRVHVSFVDVLGPSPSEMLAQMPDEPVVLVPAFLSRGYHVTSDIPAHVDVSRHPDVTVTEALGPGPQLVRVVADRLVESGWHQDDSVILAAAGTSDRGAQHDLHTMAASLSAVTGSRVELAFAATGTPRVADAVAAMRRRGCGRVVVASYLLSEGLFQDRLRASGADLVTAPLGTHPGLVRLIASRFSRARYSVEGSRQTGYPHRPAPARQHRPESPGAHRGPGVLR